VLDEFTNVVDAARGAIEIQKEFKTKNAELPENRRIEFLIYLVNPRPRPVLHVLVARASFLGYHSYHSVVHTKSHQGGPVILSK
jgi:hypothetical protein